MTRLHPSSDEEIHAMPLVPCPLCDDPAPFDASEDALECDACGVRLELAPDPMPIELALAA